MSGAGVFTLDALMVTYSPHRNWVPLLKEAPGAGYALQGHVCKGASRWCPRLNGRRVQRLRSEVKDERRRKRSNYKGCVEKKGKKDSSLGGSCPLYTRVPRPAGRCTAPALERRRTSQTLLHAANPSPCP